jgi:adenylate cyclase
MAASRRLAAILAADVAGYSRLMGADEEGTLERLKALRRELLDPKIAEHQGRIVKTTGDGLLVEFASVVNAVRCAVEIQRAMIERDLELAEDRRIKFRVGINLGDIVVEDDDIFGDAVNVAARLEALAEPGGICISWMVRDHIGERLGYPFEDIGEQSVKNIVRPIRAYAMSAAAVASTPLVTVRAQPSSTRGRKIAGRTSSRQARKVRPTTTGGGAKPAPRLSIVVLPFTNLSNDPELEYFVDAVTDDLTTDLTRISDSFVIARNTAFTYKGKPINAKQIGRDLGVRYLLEGSVRRLGDAVQVNVQLIDAETGAHVWADKFDTNRSNLAIAQTVITGRLARTLRIELLEAASRRIEQEKNHGARDLIMRGWAWLNQPASDAHLREARRSFGQALKKDPGSADARTGIAAAILLSWAAGYSKSRQKDLFDAEQLLLEALERDANHLRALSYMGWLRRLQGRLLESQIILEKAIALDRNYPVAFVQLGFTLNGLGHPEAALSHFERALQLCPRDPNLHWVYNGLGSCHLLLGHTDQAIDFYRKARAENPRIYQFSFWLAAALGLRGDIEEAKAALAESLKLNPELNSFAKLRDYFSPGQNRSPQLAALMENTSYVGLRRAGLPEQ